MPVKALRPCARGGCGALVDSGYCGLHEAQGQAGRVAADRARGSSTARGYDGVWRRFRRAYLSQVENIMCKDCGRRGATDVHHIKKLAEFPELKYEATNLRGLCGFCHDLRTGRGE